MFRAFAVVLGLLPFLLLEGLCRIGEWADASTESAFAEFAAVRPLFEADDSKRLMKVAANRREFFAHDEFPIEKSLDTFRIFVFGGSTVQGRPFSIPTSFPTYLSTALENAAPSTHWEVVNCGGVSYASYRLLPIMQECLDYEPDLYIVCTGHNEFLECITYAEVRDASPLVRDSFSMLHRSHAFRMLSNAFHSSSSSIGEPKLPAEVDAILDHSDGLAAYERRALHRGRVVAEFKSNLNAMVSLSETAGLPLLFIKPPSNLRQWPFKSEFGAATSAALQQEIHDRLEAVGETPVEDAASTLRSITETDPEFAFTWYQLGQELLGQGYVEQARVAFLRARDEDVCPLRMTSELEAVMTDVASRWKVPLLDAHQLLAEETSNGIVDDRVLVDHVHPSFTSNMKIAMAIVRTLEQMKLVIAERGTWKVDYEAAAATHLQSLDNMYFLRGQRTLDSLREWTQGRADGPPLNGAPRETVNANE